MANSETWSGDSTVTAGNPTKASDYATLANNTDYLEEALATVTDPAAADGRVVARVTEAAAAATKVMIDTRWDPASGVAQANQTVRWRVQMDDNAGTPNQTVVAFLDFVMTDVVDGTEDLRLDIGVITASTLAAELSLTGAAVYPNANDGLALGLTTNGFADLHLATGGVINWANGEVTITETDANTLTIAGVATRFDFAAGILEMNNAVEWDTGVAVVATEYSVGRDADATNQLHENVPTGAGFEWSINDAAKMVMDSSGRVLIGHTAALVQSATTPAFQVHGTTDGTGSAFIARWSADATGPYLFLSKARGGIGTYTAVVDNDVLGQIWFGGADGTDMSHIGAAIYGRVNGTPGNNDIPGEVELATYDGGAQTGSLILDAAGSLTLDGKTASAAFTLNAPTNNSTTLTWSENNTWRYRANYTAGGNYWYIETTDSDGGGTDADVIRIPDGQLTVDGNSTFDANAFDAVCPICGWHGAELPEMCPDCGSTEVEWHDDVALMETAVRADLRRSPEIVARLERLGIVNTYGGGDLFISMNRAPWFLMSGLVQTRRRLEHEVSALRSEIAALKGRN